jgi:hypothetical protein
MTYQATIINPACLTDCPKCGGEILIRLIPVEYSPRELRKMPKSMRKTWKPGDSVMFPTSVKCKSCGCKVEIPDEEM